MSEIASKRVCLLMSGGVDSSYCAYLLKKQGYSVLGMYLKLHDKEEKHDFFIQKCQKVARNLEIDFMVVDAKEEFKNSVYKDFVSSYEKGLTPNPCSVCNPLMKFGIALDKALELGCEFIATGHYAKIKNIFGLNKIQQAKDSSKDQSYFLYAISKKALDRLIFPLGDMLKEDVKPLAFKAMPWLGELESYKESQEICFVDTTYIDILKKHVNVDKQGEIKSKDGAIIGKHKGYMHYTIGKRKGLAIKGALQPHFVLDIDASKNEVIVGSKDDLKTYEVLALNKTLDASLLNKCNDLKVKVRYRSTLSNATISIEDNIIKASLKEPVFGVAKGQALVVYTGDVVLGGGVII